MSIAHKYWMIAGGIGATCFLVALALLGQYALAISTLSLFVVLGHSLMREPEQLRVRPALQVLGWVLVGLALFAVVASVIVISTER
jgi:Mn2+/Fe2+ NRAMP family transporter